MTDEPTDRPAPEHSERFFYIGAAPHRATGTRWFYDLYMFHGARRDAGYVLDDFGAWTRPDPEEPNVP